MATAHIKGTARALWTPNGGTETEHKFAVPLGVMRAFTPSRVWGEHHDWWSADKKHRRTVTIGLPSVREVVLMNRLENDPVGFMYMLEQAKLFDLTITYEPVTGGTQYPFRLVEIVGSAPDAVTIEQDRQRFGAGEYEGAFRARRTDGGTFDSLIPGGLLVSS